MAHYFDPGDGEWSSREITVRLAGRDVIVETAGGTFSPEHVDLGTRVLLDTVEPAEGTILDVGCGWGPIALEAAMQNPEATVWAIDVNARARELTRRNAQRHGLGTVHVARPDEVPAGVEFDAIWSNPPIRVGKAELHAILEAWIPRLRSGGSAWLVVAKHLGADSLMKWLRETWPAASVSKAETSKGFWVIELVAG
jgi:16S rRNA G1207 methylase RsmC